MSAEDPHMEERNSVRQRIALEASEWVSRDHLNPQEDEEFIQWLTTSREHVREFLAASGWQTTLPDDIAEWQTDVGELLSGANVIDVTTRIPPTAQQRSHILPKRRRMLVALGAVLFATLVFIVSPLLGGFWPVRSYVTSIGEQRVVALTDGSIVAMNTETRVRVDYTNEARTVYLNAGQAMFTVSHDPHRPFRVHVDGGAIVQAIGTKFDIRRRSDSTTVAVIEGKVEVIPSKTNEPGKTSLRTLVESAALAAGEGISIPDHGGMTSPALIDFAQVNAWQQRRLVFRDDTLRDIVSEFGRYSRVRMRIDGEELAERRYSGVWDADNPEALLSYLRTHGGVGVDRHDDEFVLTPQ